MSPHEKDKSKSVGKQFSLPPSGLKLPMPPVKPPKNSPSHPSGPHKPPSKK
jgi:hypothetical protein